MPSKLPFPRIYLLSSRLSDDELRQLTSQLPSTETDADKAEVFLGQVSKKERGQFELRRLGLVTVDSQRKPAKPRAKPKAPEAKRRKLGERTPSPIVISSSSENDEKPHNGRATAAAPTTVKVVKVAWLTDSIARDQVLPLASYTVYEGKKIRTVRANDGGGARNASAEASTSVVEGILQRAQGDAVQNQQSSSHASQKPHGATASDARRHYPAPPRRKKFDGPVKTPPPLVREDTPEHDQWQALPPIPDFLRTTYSCQRPTPVHPPNEKFVDELKKIRVARELMGDKIGIRAYSTAIATLSAYPYQLSVPDEVSRLPGCGPKIAQLYREFQTSGGHVREADDDETDAKLSVLRLFYGIWGVADVTARAFYNRGWRDLDDVVDYGWTELTRVQQIGVKYYNELQEKLTRAQVEAIAAHVLDHANVIHEGYQMVIAGGYRRGKELSGDVDLILSHPDEAATHLFVGRLVLSLEQEKLVTHTLTLSMANSERGQEAVSWKGNASKHSQNSGTTSRVGFDTLDKALVVWQEPMEGEGKKGGPEGTAKRTERKAATEIPAAATNTNPHQRVDIIISPWKTVGCAVLGWSGGTTFQRDLRRYCKNERGLRFDSSGARSRADGSWVDLEDFAHNPAPDMLTAERRVFAALGLEYRPPNERCTG